MKLPLGEGEADSLTQRSGNSYVKVHCPAQTRILNLGLLSPRQHPKQPVIHSAGAGLAGFSEFKKILVSSCYGLENSIPPAPTQHYECIALQNTVHIPKTVE